jgi:gliding motility-associated-like protein
MSLKGIFLIFFFQICVGKLLAQDCPANIGFEKGNFDGWTCYAGMINTGVINVSNPIQGRHTVLKNTSPQARDPYGDFPVNCPNGSGYSIMLGNSGNGSQMERVAYTFTVPEGLDTYSILYYYAVVFQDPNHVQAQQPKFTANVYDVATNQIANCGSFEFTASGGIPGFQLSPLSTPNVPVYYKDWTPVTINLKGYGGKTLRLEFTTNDCVPGGHFGYAYVDVNENCKSPITGNNYCLNAAYISLNAPPGFEKYIWHPANDLTTVLGTGVTLNISPPPPENTRYAVEVIPYYAVGCSDVFYTTVKKVDIVFNFKVKPEIKDACRGKAYDLTAPDVTAGSSPELAFEYYRDPEGLTFLSDPKAVTDDGTYYIRGSNKYGCTDVLPIKVTFNPVPVISGITPPSPVCYPATVDITNPAIVKGNDATLVYTYHTDAAAQIPIADPKAVNKSGTYYIKATNSYQCSDIKPVEIIVGEIPTVVANAVTACPPVNITTAAVTNGSTAGLTFTYWKNAEGTISLSNAESITQSGTYYIKGTSIYGCESSVVPVEVTVIDPPVFTVKDPKAVVYPETININDTFTHTPGLNFTFWLDEAATKPLTNETQITVTGIYYIKGSNACDLIKPVRISVDEPPQADLIASNTFSPNGDGINDYFKPEIVGVVRVNYLKIYNRWGQLVFETTSINNYWDGNLNGKQQSTGAYYWVYSCIDIFRKKEVIRSGQVAIVR